MNYDKIGEFIALKRKEKNLTQKQLAEKIGVTDKAVSKWERGLGCPDVSLLEILASVLDISILEILKGRVIEDEVIKVTEMNDYVKDTVNYSNLNNKEKIKKLFSMLIAILIIVIGGFLIILNVNHIIYLNQKYQYYFDNEYMQNLKLTMNKIENNIEIIKNNKGIFSVEDYNEIVGNLEAGYEMYKNIPILKYTGVKEFNLNDIYLIDLNMPPRMRLFNILRILVQYDTKVDNYFTLYKDMWILIGYLGDTTYLEPKMTCRYKLLTLFDYNYSDLEKFKIETRVYNYGYLIDTFYYLTELIKEVGDIHE